MPKEFSASWSVFWACTWCGEPFKPKTRHNGIKNRTCDKPQCQEKLKLYQMLKNDNNALFHFLKNLEIKREGEKDG
jgi:hypothetical protein